MDNSKKKNNFENLSQFSRKKIIKFIADNDAKGLEIYINLIKTLKLKNVIFLDDTFKNFSINVSFWDVLKDQSKIKLFETLIKYCIKNEVKSYENFLNIFLKDYSTEHLNCICSYETNLDERSKYMLKMVVSTNELVYERIEKVRLLIRRFKYTDMYINHMIDICICDNISTILYNVLMISANNNIKLNIGNCLKDNDQSNLMIILEFIEQLTDLDKRYIFEHNSKNVWVDCLENPTIFKLLIEFCIKHNCWDTRAQLCRAVFNGKLEIVKILHDVGKITTDEIVTMEGYFCGSSGLFLVKDVMIAEYLLQNYSYTIEHIEHAIKKTTIYNIKVLFEAKLAELTKPAIVQESDNSVIVIKDQKKLIIRNSDGTLEQWEKHE